MEFKASLICVENNSARVLFVKKPSTYMLL